MLRFIIFDIKTKKSHWHLKVKRINTFSFFIVCTAKPSERVPMRDERYFSNRSLHSRDEKVHREEVNKHNKRLSMNLNTRTDVLRTIAKRRSRANTNSAIFLRSPAAGSGGGGTGAAVKTRKFSTPDMLNKHQMLRRKSVESSEQLRLFRASLTPRSNKTNNNSCANVADVEEVVEEEEEEEEKGDDGEKEEQNTHHPMNRIRKVSNIFRKISIGSKVINRRSLIQNNVKIPIFKFFY